MAGRRSRTGCATCRQRKLKCSEEKPICAQCARSRRQCLPSDGLAFRHEQNASLNSEQPQGQQRSLGNFYNDRKMYTKEQLKNFVPLGPNFEWRYVTDVYAEESDQTPPRGTSSPQAYQREVASHSLEALSTAAAENQQYQPPNTYAEINNMFPGTTGGYGPAGNLQGPAQNGNLRFLLNPTSTPTAMIDPNLDTSALESMREEAEHIANESQKSKGQAENQSDETQPTAHSEEQMAVLLKTYEGEQQA